MHELPFSNLNVTSMDMFVLIFVSRTVIWKTAVVPLVISLAAGSMSAPSLAQVQQRQAVDQLYLVL